MSAKIPYLSSPGSLTTVLNRIKSAATPPTFNNDFVEAKLQIKGGAGRAIPPFMKKIGFVAGDGTPTHIYHRFRNPATTGSAAAESLKTGYKSLYEINEYAHELSDPQLKGLIVQVTGLAEDNKVVDLTLSTFKKLKAFANFDGTSEVKPEEEAQEDAKHVTPPSGASANGIGFNIAYTINLNLPATTNIEVFNAIFKSLKENLLRG
jgi:hypothetical protein